MKHRHEPEHLWTGSHLFTPLQLGKHANGTLVENRCHDRSGQGSPRSSETDKKEIEHLLLTQLPTRIRPTTNHWKILLRLTISMSSPLSPEILTSSDNLLNAEVYADELAQIMEDPYSLALTVAAFDNDPTGTAILRLFSFITDSMDSTRREMMRLCGEWEEVFKYAIENNHFWRTMRPIIRNHHERQNQCSTPPSPLQPLFDEHSLSTTNIYPPPSVSGDDNSPQTIENLSPESTTTEPAQLESPSTVFLTVNESEPGTQQNPIDVDRLFVWQDTPHPAAGFTWRTNSNPAFGRTIPIHTPTASHHWTSFISVFVTGMATALTGVSKWGRSSARTAVKWYMGQSIVAKDDVTKGIFIPKCNSVSFVVNQVILWVTVLHSKYPSQ